VNIDQNPFFILHANPRDDRQRLVELADEQTLIQDSQLVTEARATLTNPRRRLAAEIAWLPGVSPSRCQAVIESITNHAETILQAQMFPPLAKANIVASTLDKCTRQLNKIDFAHAVRVVCEAFEQVNGEEVQSLLNQDRAVSGFPEVTDLTVIGQALETRRTELRRLLKGAFNQLSSKALVYFLTHVVEEVTQLGSASAPALLDDLVDAYELDARAYFQKQRETIQTTADNIRRVADNGNDDQRLYPLVKDFCKLVANWDVIAQPIQVSVHSRGLVHEASEDMAGLVRGLAIWLYNEHGLLEAAKRLTNLQRHVFAELDHVVERVSEDSKALDEIELQQTETRNRAEEQANAWRAEMNYEAKWGLAFKKHVAISAECIVWEGRKTPLNAISVVRWGGTRHSVNGIPTGTTYTIVYKRHDGWPITIETRKEEVYMNLIERLWKGVGVRLLTEMLDELRNGESRHFGNAVIWDTGIELNRPKLFRANEKVACSWGGLEVTNGDGCFIIKKKDEKKVNIVLDYQKDDNTHILEAAIRAFFKKTNSDRISSLLN
jgi:hypothetical protein